MKKKENGEWRLEIPLESAGESEISQFEKLLKTISVEGLEISRITITVLKLLTSSDQASLSLVNLLYRNSIRQCKRTFSVTKRNKTACLAEAKKILAKLNYIANITTT